MMAKDSSLLVLVVAPTGSDGPNIGQVLRKARVKAEICRTLDEAAEKFSTGIGALVVTEEALVRNQGRQLARELEAQPTWSDVPVVLVASGESIHHWATAAARTLGSRSYVTLVARPSTTATLVAAVTAALHVRGRQYQVRDLLTEREALLASLEEKVRERTTKLQELVAELESFSYSVSHDLRAPLRVMAGYAQLVLSDFRPTLVPEVEHYVERIARSAERMDQLTQDVLAYTRLSRADIKLESIDLAATVNDIIDQYPALASHGAISVRQPLGRVIAHGPSLAQGLSNLLDNALKFARPNVPVRITIFARTRGDRVRISVKDNGVGIAPEHQQKIFQIFERVATHTVPGTGIGLAIVKKAAERMGGSVGLSSRLGVGSEFWLELAGPAPGRKSRRQRGT